MDNSNQQNGFRPQTILNSLPEGIQIIIPFAPQVSIVMILSIEQVKEALERCLKLRMVDKQAMKRLVEGGDLRV